MCSSRKPWRSKINCSAFEFTQTWLSVLVSDTEVAMEDYKYICSDRTENRPAGGVAIFLTYLMTVSTISFPPNPSINLFSRIIDPSRQTILMFCLYHPLNSPASSNTALLRRICNLHADYPRLLLLGDFNAPLKNWLDVSVDTRAKSFDTLLLEVCKTRLMYQHVDK